MKGSYIVVSTFILFTLMLLTAVSVNFDVASIFQPLVGEGAMTAAFVPVFTDFVKGKNEDEVWRFAASFFAVMTCILAGLAVAGVAAAPLYIRYGFGLGYAVADRCALTLRFTPTGGFGHAPGLTLGDARRPAAGFGPADPGRLALAPTGSGGLGGGVAAARGAALRPGTGHAIGCAV